MKIFSLISKFLPEQTAFTHCDIPCGIYDPHNAQMAAHTVLRMTNMLDELKPSRQEPDFEERKRIISQIARLTRVKEEHGELVEEELGTLENDYFKDEHFKKFPNLKSLIEEGVMLSIKTRQNIDIDAAKKLLDATMQIAEIFYKTKNLEPVRVSSGYPTEGEIVSHK
ncbi:MAG: superoxide dismutase, Ni [Candidatus Levybacteria bacterium RIFCSPLOWO2_01_FULL_38_13]|nr:MAG: superoxide dismutase, Ni [Candidatus Levybacteria bacterium RIFCSPHIGHO2_01_FULL_41_15]OGH34867.1 MAG: superoxide dismutase, Ni [Candidatus Levybacteria bacterium RIFCSPLOWO2_01_FULL_38_13]